MRRFKSRTIRLGAIRVHARKSRHETTKLERTL